MTLSQHFRRRNAGTGEMSLPAKNAIVSHLEDSKAGARELARVIH